MQRTLRFDYTPSLAASLRYFLSAPLFLLAAAALLCWQGPAALMSRWSPAALALTHLTTLGFLGLTMTGAIFQLLPVVASMRLPGARRLSHGVFGLLLAGALLLPSGFLVGAPILFKAALLCLCAGFVGLLIAVARGVMSIPQSPAVATLRTMRLALASLAFAVLVGGMLASAFGWPQGPALPLSLLTELHVVWAAPGWLGLLVIGVGFQVVPMFMVTPVYPPWLTRWLGRTIFLLLMGDSIARLNAWSVLARVSGALAAMGLLAFAVTTLILLARRTRPTADATTLFWRLAMLSLAGCTVAWIAHAALGMVIAPVALGVLFVFGFAGSAVSGMLYKIVPFLLWYHASEKAGIHHRAPSIKKLLPDRSGKIQFYVHTIALSLLVAAALWPDLLARLGGLALMVSSALLEINLIGAARKYRVAVRQMASVGVVA